MSRFLHTIALASVLTLACNQTEARTRTTMSGLRNSTLPVTVIEPDSTLSQETPCIDPSAVTLRGYAKRASDAKESFFVTNNTNGRMSHVTLLLRYTSLKGELLHERQVTVAVQLQPRQSQLVSISSWDVQRLFYYYAGPKPRKAATPYSVAYRLLGYDVPVGSTE